MKFQVELRDLRAAIAAVLPHTEDDGGRFGRIRFWVDPINVMIGATNTITVGLAVVSTMTDDTLLPDDEGRFPAFDLGPDEAKKILAVHKVRKVSGEEVEQTILFDVQTDSVVTHDISGLFAGTESLVVPLAEPVDGYPELPGYLGSNVHRAETEITSYAAEPLGLSGPALAAFVTAGKAYGAAPVLRLVQVADGRFVGVVTVGESFIGLVTARDVREQILADDTDALEAWEHWANRLPDRMLPPRADSGAADDARVELRVVDAPPSGAGAEAEE